MGLTILKIAVGNPARPEVTEDVEFLVDSGAIYSVVPVKILKKLGIKPLSEEEFRLANTLESLGLMLDPLKRELKPLPMMMASFSSH